MRKFFACLYICLTGLVLMNCGDKKSAVTQTTFTRADSLTDKYLAYQDSILQSWNIMINDDNQKIKAMHNLLHELQITSTDDRDILHNYEEQLEQLKSLRYTQQSLGDEEVVEEYDFASGTLVAELISLAESQTQFTYNTTLQKLVENIRMADQRVNNYREEYDYIVLQYNHFLQRNAMHLHELGHGDSVLQKHQFKMVSTD